MDRNSQFAPAYAALDAAKAAAVDFDTATAALEAQQNDATAKFRAYNAVAWMLGPDVRGAASDQQKIDAMQKKIAYEASAAAVPALFAAASAASQARGGAWQQLNGVVQSLLQNPGASENMGGTTL